MAPEGGRRVEKAGGGRLTGASAVWGRARGVETLPWWSPGKVVGLASGPRTGKKIDTIPGGGNRRPENRQQTGHHDLDGRRTGKRLDTSSDVGPGEAGARQET